MSISDEDMRLVEEAIFKGYTAKSYKVLAGRRTISVATSLPCELDLIDDIIADEVRFAEANKQPCSQHYVDSRQKMLGLALCFVGVDGVDFGPQVDIKFATLKAAIGTFNRALVTGDLKGVVELKQTVKTAVSRRASAIAASIPSGLSDIISSRRYDLESLVIQALNQAEIVPKS